MSLIPNYLCSALNFLFLYSSAFQTSSGTMEKVHTPSSHILYESLTMTVGTTNEKAFKVTLGEGRNDSISKLSGVYFSYMYHIQAAWFHSILSPWSSTHLPAVGVFFTPPPQFEKHCRAGTFVTTDHTCINPSKCSF